MTKNEMTNKTAPETTQNTSSQPSHSEHPPHHPAYEENRPFQSRALVFIALLAGTWAAAEAQAFFVPLALAMLFSFLMAPLLRAFLKTKMPEWAALICTLLVVLLPIVTVGVAAVQQVQSMIQDYPKIIRALEHSIQQLSTSPIGEKLQIQQFLSTTNLIDTLSSQASKGATLLLGGIGALVDASSKLLLIFILAVLMVVYRAHIRKNFEKILSQSTSISSTLLLEESTSLIQKFLVARIVLVFAIGLAATLILTVFGVRYSLALGSIIGVMTLVPAIGFFISLVPVVVVMVASGQSPLVMVGASASLIFLSFLEGNVFTPKMIGKSLNINILASFLGLFGGGLIWGVWGMLLSVPILGVIRIICSAVPGLQPWGNLLSEREDKELNMKFLKARRIWAALEKKLPTQ